MSSGELSSEPFRILRVTWKIPNYLQLAFNFGPHLQSPEFLFDDDRYYILLTSILNSIDFSLVKLSNFFGVVSVTDNSYEVALKSKTGKEIALRKITLGSAISGILQISFSTQGSEFEKNRDLYLPDGALTVVCSVRCREPSNAGGPKCAQANTSNVEEEQERLQSTFLGVPTLLSHYRQLLQKGVESDACFLVGGKEFRAHRCVLRARSTVFEAMFGHETAEKESGRVTVDDLDPDSFGEFLEYLYTGSVGAGLSDDNAFGLYAAADKYDVPTLKSECVAHMRRTLSVDSFCDVMTVALQHREEDLLQKAARFFKANLARVVVTPKWKQFITNNGASANELLVKAFVPEEQ